MIGPADIEDMMLEFAAAEAEASGQAPPRESVLATDKLVMGHWSDVGREAYAPCSYAAAHEALGWVQSRNQTSIRQNLIVQRIQAPAIQL